MDKYEFKLSLDEINHLIQERRFEEAANIADTIDWNHVRSTQTLGRVSEVYKIVGDYERSRDVMEIAYLREPENPNVVYSLCELSLHLYGTGALQDDYARGLQMLREYQALEPSNPKRLILQYRMYDVSHVSDDEKITVLEQLRREQPSARWEYELAKLYASSGDGIRAAALCTDIMEIFGGTYGTKAQRLLQQLQLDQQTEPGAAAVDVDAVKAVLEEEVPKAMGSSTQVEAGASPGAQEVSVRTKSGPDIEAAPDASDEFTEYSYGRDASGNAPGRDEQELSSEPDVRPQPAQEVLQQTPVYERSAFGARDTAVQASDTPADVPSYVTRGQYGQEPAPAPDSQPQGSSYGTAAASGSPSGPGQVTETETSISEVMAEWERIRADIRRANDEKRAERIMQDTGSILQSFDETARHGLLEDIEKGVARQRRHARSGQYGSQDADVRRGERPARSENAAYRDRGMDTIEREDSDRRGDGYDSGERGRRPRRPEPYGEPGYYGEGSAAREEEYDEAGYEDRPYEESGADRFADAAYEEPGRYDEPGYDEESPQGQDPYYEGEPASGTESGYYEDGPASGAESGYYEEEPVSGSESEYYDEPEDVPVREAAPVGESGASPAQEKGPSGAAASALPELSDVTSASGQGGEQPSDARGQESSSAVNEDANGVPLRNDDDDTRVYRPEAANAATRRWNAEEVHRLIQRSRRKATQKPQEKVRREEEPVPSYVPGHGSAAVQPEEQALEDAFYDELEDAPQAGEESAYEEPIYEEPICEEPVHKEPDAPIPAELDGAVPVDEEEFNTARDEWEEPAPDGEYNVKADRRERHAPIPTESASDASCEEESAAASQGDQEEEGAEPAAGSLGNAADAASSDAAAQKGRRELTRDERRLFGPFCRMKDNVDQLTEALEQVSLSSTTGNLLILGNEATADRVARGILDIIRHSDSNFTGKIARTSGESLNHLDAKGFARTFARLESGALIVTHAADIAPKTMERLYQEIEGHERGLILILTDGNKKLEQFRRDNEKYLGSFTAVITIKPLDDKALVSYAKDYALSQDYSIDEFGQLALAQRISSMQTQSHHVTLKEVRDLVDEAISYASKKNLNTLVEIITRKRYDEDDRIILHEKDFSHY